MKRSELEVGKVYEYTKWSVAVVGEFLGFVEVPSRTSSFAAPTVKAEFRQLSLTPWLSKYGMQEAVTLKQVVQKYADSYDEARRLLDEEQERKVAWAQELRAKKARAVDAETVLKVALESPRVSVEPTKFGNSFTIQLPSDVLDVLLEVLNPSLEKAGL